MWCVSHYFSLPDRISHLCSFRFEFRFPCRVLHNIRTVDRRGDSSEGVRRASHSGFESVSTNYNDCRTIVARTVTPIRICFGTTHKLQWRKQQRSLTRCNTGPSSSARVLKTRPARRSMVLPRATQGRDDTARERQPAHLSVSRFESKRDRVVRTEGTDAR